MKIVLAAVNAKYIHSNLAVYSLQAYAQQNRADGKDIEIAEYTINHSKDAVLMDLYRKRPDVLACSCYIWNIDYIKELTAEFKKLLPDVPIWLGGPEVSYDAPQVLEACPQVSGVMAGEGEQTFLELTEHYHGTGKALKDIPGLIWRDEKGDICINASRELTDLDQIPFIYKNLEQFENRILYYETSRGCPFSCAYCLSSIDKRVRFRSLSLVEKELDFFLAHKVPQVKFVDRTFNCDRVRARKIWTYISDHDNGITNFHFEISADLLGEEDLKIFRDMRPGLIQLEIGVQSVNPDTIREIRRTMDLPRLREMVKNVHQGKNIHQHLDLIAGLPYEDYESFRESFGQVYAMEPEQLQLGFLKVLKGSYMHEMAEHYGIVYKDHAPYEVLYTKWLSYEDLMRLKAVEEMTEIYYNSGQFTWTMRHLIKEFENPFDLYEALGVYYEKNNLDKVSHSRMRRYDILLSFIEAYVSPEKTDLYKEVLLLDLYLREHMKMRPGWAKDQGAYKEACMKFFQKEEEHRTYLRGYEAYSARQMMHLCHVEFFHFPVMDLTAPQKPSKSGYPMLFDYRNRDPLTKDAAVYCLDKKEFA